MEPRKSRRFCSLALRSVLSSHKPGCCTTEKSRLRFLSKPASHMLNHRYLSGLCHFGSHQEQLVDAPVDHAATLRHPSSQDILPRLLSFHVTGRSSKFLEALYQQTLFTMDTSRSRSHTETALTMAPLARGPQTAEQVAAFALFSFLHVSCTQCRCPCNQPAPGPRRSSLPSLDMGFSATGGGVTGNEHLAPWCGLEATIALACAWCGIQAKHLVPVMEPNPRPE